ncbi:hypothetical protein HUU42_09600 [bacterium]|nr:hypothetical protein [bacterium]
MLRPIVIILLVLTNIGCDKKTESIVCDPAVDKDTNLFATNAKKLAVREFFENNLPAKNSIVIPFSHYEPIRQALLAIYLTQSPEAKLILDTLKINAASISLNEVSVNVSNDATWLNDFKKGHTTGDTLLDQIMCSYDLSVIDYGNFQELTTIILRTDYEVNTNALGKALNVVLWISSGTGNHRFGDSRDILMTRGVDYMDFTFQQFYGDCLAGCVEHDFWNFRVYINNQVEYLGKGHYP